MNKKMFYEAPDAEVIELKLEGYLMQSGYGDDGSPTDLEDGGNYGNF